MNPPYAWRMGTYSYAIPKNVTFQASATKTASFNSSSQNDARLWQQLIVVVNVSSTSGSSPTLDITLQGSVDNSTWLGIDSVDLEQITTDGQYVYAIRGPFSFKYLRLRGVITGTTPSFSVVIEGWAIGPNA